MQPLTHLLGHSLTQPYYLQSIRPTCLATTTTPGCCTRSAISASEASRTSVWLLRTAVASVLSNLSLIASLISCGHCLTSSRSSCSAFLHMALCPLSIMVLEQRHAHLLGCCRCLNAQRHVLDDFSVSCVSRRISFRRAAAPFCAA